MISRANSNVLVRLDYRNYSWEAYVSLNEPSWASARLLSHAVAQFVWVVTKVIIHCRTTVHQQVGYAQSRYCNGRWTRTDILMDQFKLNMDSWQTLWLLWALSVQGLLWLLQLFDDSRSNYVFFVSHSRSVLTNHWCSTQHKVHRSLVHVCMR